MKSLTIPIRVVSKSNKRWHWTERAAQANLERTATTYAWKSELRKWLPILPARITLIRIGPKVMDRDNNAIALKSVQDAIADLIGTDDKDPLILWHPAQAIGKEYAVQVLIEEFNQHTSCPCGALHPTHLPARCYHCGQSMEA